MIAIRRLDVNDVSVLAMLAAEDGDFDIEGRGEPIEAPDPVRAREYLSNPTVLFWISTDNNARTAEATDAATARPAEVITGFLQCLVLPIRTGRGREILVYEIGVRKPYRRQGVGRALMLHMESWMHDNAVDEMWVAADNPGAEMFYNACGYERTKPGYFQPVYMSRELGGE